MTYTVHEVAKLSGVTIKTLYHYQKINLLQPAEIAENGYRLYGDRELERLQQILFYRELDFPLQKIKDVLQDDTSRLQTLIEQKFLLKSREQRLSAVLETLDQAIERAEKGETMSKETMFKGLNKEQWENTLSKQNDHLKKEYDVAIEATYIEVDEMNAKAHEAQQFMSFLANALRSGLSADDATVQKTIEKHLQFMQKELAIDAQGFVDQTKFLMKDSFHRQMMESQQIGLSYYLVSAAESYANQ